MKKLISVLFTTTVICFSSILFLAGETKDPLDFKKIAEMSILYDSGIVLIKSGQTVSGYKKINEAFKYFDSIFAKERVISSTDSCYFIRKEYVDSKNRFFIFSCYKPEKDISESQEKGKSLIFAIEGVDDHSFNINKQSKTDNSILEIFESAQAFKGKIQIKEIVASKKIDPLDSEGIYTLDSTETIIVFCKILSLTPVEVKPEDK